MGRGFISGFIWGSVIAATLLWLASQVGGFVALLAPPDPRDVSVAPADVASNSITSQGAPVAPSEQSASTADPAMQPTLGTAQPDAAPVADTAQLARPAAGDVAAETPAPEVEEAPVVGGTSDSGVATGIVSSVPDQPAGERAPNLATAPPAVPAPEQAAQSQANQQQAPAGNPVQPVGEAAQAPAPESASEPVAPAAPRADATPAVTDFSAPQVVETPKAEPIPAPAPPAEPPKPAQSSGAEAPANKTAQAPSGGSLPVVRKSGETVVAGGSHFPSSTTGRRFPTITTAPEAAPDTASDGAAAPGTDGASEEGEAAIDPSTLPAIQRYALPFENTDGRPMMAVVLLPGAIGSPTAGEPLPFPIGYVVDASRSDAAQRMRAALNAGGEVVALTPLPEGATPADVEVAFQTYFRTVPEAVAVIDVPEAVFQSRRPVASQVVEALASGGYGMITYSRGLNTALQIAERDGVPAAPVFRVIDDNGRDGAAIKRFLDQAAFRAGQHKRVILVAHDRPETRRALLEWSLGNRASTVALAPVSAVLTAN